MTSGPVSVDLLGVVAYGELSAFTRLAADADRAPDLAGRAALAALAAVEMEHYARIRDHLAERGVDVLGAMAPFVAPLEVFQRSVASRDWGESLVLAHLGRGLVTDLQGELLARLEGAEADLVREVLPQSPSGALEHAVRAACADEHARPRLALAARRLLGEALAVAAAVLDARPGVAAAVLGDDSAAQRRTVFKRIKSQHAKRVSALGL